MNSCGFSFDTTNRCNRWISNSPLVTTHETVLLAPSTVVRQFALPWLWAPFDLGRFDRAATVRGHVGQ